MSEIKIQHEIFMSFSKSGVVKSSSTDFKEIFLSSMDEKIEVPADWKKYQLGCSFGEGMTATFPPDDAPDYFKKAWYDVCSKMDEYTGIEFNQNFDSALTYGYYYYVYDRKEGAEGFNVWNARVESLGCVGCLELAIRTQEQCYHDNVRGGNEKKFTDLMKNSLDALQEIMAKCLESGDPSIDRQIRMADIDFEKSKKKILHEAEMWLKQNGGDDIATMSDEKFNALMDKVQPTITKFLPDGTILTINASDGKIISWDKSEKLYNLDILQTI